MHKKAIFILLLLCTTLISIAQQKFQFSPEKPKPGDIIQITYTPTANEGETAPLVEGVAYQYTQRNFFAEDLVLTREGTSWKGTVKAADDISLLFFGFKTGESFDNNGNQGYYILLHEGEQPRPLAYFTLGQFYQYMGSRVGVESNNEKALEMMEKEHELYPASRSEILVPMVSLRARIKKEEAAKAYQDAI